MTATLLGACNPFNDQPARFVGVAPAVALHPFARLEILVVREEMLDLAAGDVRQIGIVLDVGIALRQPRRDRFLEVTSVFVV